MTPTDTMQMRLGDIVTLNYAMLKAPEKPPYPIQKQKDFEIWTYRKYEPLCMEYG